MPIFGQAIVNDAPGGLRGFLEVTSPGFTSTHVRAVTLHPALVSAIAADTFRVNQGTLLGVDKADPTAGYKVVIGDASTAAWNVIMTSVTGGIYQALVNSDTPDVAGIGKVAILDAPFYECTTDQVDVTTATAAVGNFVTASIAVNGFGKLTDLGAAHVVTTALGRVVKSRPNVARPNGLPGTVTVYTVRFKGSAYGF